MTTIQTNPDGRCFFRSIAIDQNLSLQKSLRNKNGLLYNKKLRLTEETKYADNLRALAIHHMFMHFAEFENKTSNNSEVVVNADMPLTIRYDSLQDRMAEMTKVHTMPGELEIIAMSNALEAPISVFHEDGNQLDYGTEYPIDKAFRVQFVNLKGDAVGHYEPFKKTLPSLNQTQDNCNSWYCFICSEDTKENMLRCQTCSIWVHEACANTDSCMGFTCDNCF